ncbi:hypothetical protein FA95DRAFT_1570086 [Auriscalpium vulgare]|uniref:Uncharacterized protein n=1 Tax=Auriscalpium vulgare TaxID=40419 RepID=A0ACB8S513_9AGAM|nr:hypothetical protein FA95DRAFT_1570086 [Auriscalpium vulgare]
MAESVEYLVYEVAYGLLPLVGHDSQMRSKVGTVASNRSFTGTTIEDGAAVKIVAWRVLDADNCSFTNAQTPSRAAMASMYLVHFLLNPLPALCAPVTELAVLSPKQAFNTSAVVRVLDRAMICLNGIDERESARVAYGKALGEPVVYVVVAGWPSVEVNCNFYYYDT